MLELPPEEMRRLGYRAIEAGWSSTSKGSTTCRRSACPAPGISPSPGSPARTSPQIRPRLSTPSSTRCSRSGCSRPIRGCSRGSAAHRRTSARSPSSSRRASTPSRRAGRFGCDRRRAAVLDWLRGWLGHAAGTRGSSSAVAPSGTSPRSPRPLHAGRTGTRRRGTSRSRRTPPSSARGAYSASTRLTCACSRPTRTRLHAPAVHAAVEPTRARPRAVPAHRQGGHDLHGSGRPAPRARRPRPARRLWLHVDGRLRRISKAAETGTPWRGSIAPTSSPSIRTSGSSSRTRSEPCSSAPRAARVGVRARRRYLRDTAAATWSFGSAAAVSRAPAGCGSSFRSRSSASMRSERRSPAGSRSPSTPRRSSRARPEWEVVSPAKLGIVCFRPGKRISDANGAQRRGRGIRGAEHDDRRRRSARLCTINPRTTIAEIEQTILRFEEFR